ncbi:SusC/RagA family TonB-linked outer membrane protein [Flavobacterium phragmitis]|uniref:TonB-linked outer membrane protein, SusC/RagA family n=1 Tax=Flavobacterium phragmitis TaxID=739143 RepID=A0A1I1WQM6_9FLAO|nr:TonB-dependent receptor [Flavobacterium phragmitis]SFD95723.1 TonB-linked outer membrane protein, SusC/RagA family [Flavobacterium phragmitis]
MKNKWSLFAVFCMCVFMHTLGYAQNKTVKGTITDVSGLPIPGANVIIKGTKQGTSTDFDGKYSISATAGQVLVFSSTGSKTVEKTVGTNSEINVVLTDEISQLNEIVVVGYGTQKKSDVTGSVSTINAEQLMNRPVSNATEALQGKIAGVDITTNERPGSLGTVRIRGTRSLTASNDPLYVVDGVPLMSASAIETLNPRDIESMDILKDASATAIYGSRGANGVIIVTTKQGKAGRFSLNYAGTVTTSEIVDRSPSMSASDFITFRRWAAYNLDPTKYANPATPTYDNDKLIFDSALDGQTSRDNVLKGWASGSWDASKVTNTDWTDYVTQGGVSTEHVISASGGSEKVNTYGSVGYLDNQGTQRGQWYKRYTAKLTSNINPVDWFKMNASFNVSWSEQDYGMSTLSARSGTAPDAIYGAAKQIYNIAVPYDANGNLIINPGGESGVYTVMDEWNKSTQQSQTMRILANFSASLDFGKMTKSLEGLTYKLNFGPDYRHWREGAYIDGTSSLKVNSNGSAGVNFARLQNRRDLSWTVDNIINYDRTFAVKHKVGLTLLQTASSWNIENSSMSANNIPKPSFLWNAMGSVDATNAANNARMSSGLTERAISSYMIRTNYGYDNRYLLTVSGRWDGVTQLSEGHKWDFFPSAALAWRINNEKFLKDVAWVDNLKLRLGVGTSGNSSVDPYGTLGNISQIFLPFNGMSNVIGFTTNEPYYTSTQTGMPNKNLGWEKTTQYNLGLDFSFLKNRISGTVDVYKSDTKDLLLQVDIPPVSGYPYIVSNIGETKNRGVEVTLNLIPIQTGSGFTWETNLNGAWQKDQIVSLANGAQDMVSNSWFIGQSIAVRYGYDNQGIWQNTPEDLAEMAKWNANGYKFTPGNVRPKDQNGDYKMDGTDRVVVGNSNPNWTMGWNNNFTYKGFDLGINLYGRMGYTASLGGEALTAHANQRETDYWTPDNPNAEFQKPILGQATSGSADAFSGLLGFQKAAFVKIRNISLGYNLSKDFANKIGLANMKFYVQAVNPGSIYQSLDWYDFDTNRTYFNRSFVMGVEVGF